MQTKENFPGLHNKEEITGDRIRGSRMDLGDCVIELGYINENLHCIRFGIAEDAIPLNLKMIDSALYYINLGLERLIDKMEELI